MSKKTAIVDEAPVRVKPCELTDTEVFQLMRAYTADKTCITDDDALTLCRWAQARKAGAYLLEAVVRGQVTVEVEDGVVTLGPLAARLPSPEGAL